MKKNRTRVFIIGLSLFCLIVCARSIAAEYTDHGKASETSDAGKDHAQVTQEMIAILDEDPELKALMEESIAIAAVYNPDRKTNSIQSLEAYYDFLDWSATCMPWNILDVAHPSLYSRIDQSLNYFYFLLDQLLPAVR